MNKKSVLTIIIIVVLVGALSLIVSSNFLEKNKEYPNENQEDKQKEEVVENSEIIKDINNPSSLEIKETLFEVKDDTVTIKRSLVKGDLEHNDFQQYEYQEFKINENTIVEPINKKDAYLVPENIIGPANILKYIYENYFNDYLIYVNIAYSTPSELSPRGNQTSNCPASTPPADPEALEDNSCEPVPHTGVVANLNNNTEEHNLLYVKWRIVPKE